MNIIQTFTLALALPSVLAAPSPARGAARDLLDWRARAVVYGIAPHAFVDGTGRRALPEIRRRLPELAALGINVLWLLPVTPPAASGQAYDVVDFTKVNPALGSEDDLRALVRDAHRRGLRVMLDVPVNHSSAAHPFLRDVAARGPASPYYDFYQHDVSADAPYRRHQNVLTDDASNFIYYFWRELLNFNYGSPRLRDYVLTTLRGWLTRFGIDGFRLDASWAPSSRWPGFYAWITNGLRATKSDIAILAEDKAGYPAMFGRGGRTHLRGSGVDWAYDWNNEDENWVSRWSFTAGDGGDHETVFNVKSAREAADAFVRGLGYTANAEAQPLRFLENNDTPGFARHHSRRQMRFAAAVTFVLPGVPLIFAGQETGNTHERYAHAALDPRRPMNARDPGLFAYYRGLIRRRLASPALTAGRMVGLARPSPTRVRFTRVLGAHRANVELRFDRGEVWVDGVRVTL